MAQKSLDRRLTEMAKANRALARRARRTRCPCPSSVLNLGAAVATLATHAACVEDLNRFLDETVLEDLLGERRRLADDLELLDGLAQRGSDSPDVLSLAGALLERIAALVELEDRVLYQPLLRLAMSGETETPSRARKRERA